MKEVESDSEGEFKVTSLTSYAGKTFGKWKTSGCFKQHQSDCVLFSIEGHDNLLLKLSESNVSTEIEALHDLEDRGLLQHFPVFQTGHALGETCGPTGLVEAPAFYVMKKMDGDFLHLDPQLLAANLKSIGRQLITQLRCLHECYLLHSDVKANNLLWKMEDGELVASIADLGLASSVEAGIVQPVADEHFVVNCGAKSLFHPFTPLMDLYGLGLALARVLMTFSIPDICYCDQTKLLFNTEVFMFNFFEVRNTISPLLHDYFELLESLNWEGIQSAEVYEALCATLANGAPQQGAGT